MSTIAVIGAGAAGMMAALSAGRAGASVTILEHSSTPGAKLLLTGGGRCNFSHDCPARDFVSVLGRRGKFLGHALAALDPFATRALFSEIGVPSMVEPDGRIVPVSQRAVDVRRALVEALAGAGVRTSTGVDVLGMSRDAGGWAVECAGGPKPVFDRVILAAGGMSCPATGSDGSGWTIARALGHSVIHPIPAEVPLVTAGFPVERLQGLTVENIELSLAGSKIGTRRGNLLFTHFGISGPAVLDISADVSEALSQEREATLLVDLAPDRDDETIVRALAAGPAALRRILPSRLAALVGEMADDVPEHQRLNLVRKLPIRISRTRGFDYAMITRGGVNLREVDPASMQSKLNEGLYFAGEILDLDGPMGGFNLQIAWSTGWLAGKAAAQG